MQHEMYDSWFLTGLYMKRNFAQKSATGIVWPLGLYELKFCSKKCDMKSVTLGFIWTEILLKKVRHEMCDPWFLPAYIWNEILLKKVRHEKCDPWCWKKGMVVTQFRNDFFYYDSKNILWIQEFHEHLFPTTTRTTITWIFC